MTRVVSPLRSIPARASQTFFLDRLSSSIVDQGRYQLKQETKMATNNENQTEKKEKRVPDFNVFHTVKVDGREKDLFYEVGTGFINSDGSFNLFTVHGPLHVRPVKSKK